MYHYLSKAQEKIVCTFYMNESTEKLEREQKKKKELKN